MNSSKVLPNTDTIQIQISTRDNLSFVFYVCILLLQYIYIYTGKPSNVVDYLINQLTTTIKQI